MNIKFTIKGRLPSLNDYTSANRSNKYVGAKLKSASEIAIKQAILKAKLEKVYKYPVKLKITWYEPNSRRDVDNIMFATKFICDSLVSCKILEDDSQKYIKEISNTVCVDKNNPRIEVEICHVKIA